MGLGRNGQDGGGGGHRFGRAVWCGSGEVGCIRSPLQGRRARASLRQQGRSVPQSQVSFLSMAFKLDLRTLDLVSHELVDFGFGPAGSEMVLRVTVSLRIAA